MKKLALLAAACAAICTPAFAHPDGFGLPEAEPTPAAAPSRDQVKLVQAGWLLAVPGQQPLRERTIVVRNDRIERIDKGFTAATAVANADVEVIDLRDR
ncbi:MAG TPA: hypothetical protein VEZ59_05970, partial [Sphingopyxis sp.]|nr:hypothetical protein [Sphingopyxis sp.]